MNNRPPPRRGLGRGLGSLIPTGPSPTEPRAQDVAGNGAATATADPPEASAPPPIEAPAAPPADWIGRIPAPASPRDAPTPGGFRTGGHLTVSSDSTTAASYGDDVDALQPVAGAYYAELAVSSIEPNPRQPRQAFDEEAMAELVHSIREVGLLQPVVVRSVGEQRYELIMGERRWRATQAAGLDTIPAIIRDTGDDVMLRDALLENLHRAQLNPLEEAAAYQQLLDDFGCTHDELANRIGRSRPQISNTLRLLKLSPAVQRRVAAGVLSAGHARTLLSVTGADEQDRLAARVVAEGISVRGLEELVAVGEFGASRAPTRRRSKEDRPELGALAERLSDRFDTRVTLDVGRTKGRLTIEFASVEDLHRIVELMEP